MAKRPTKAERDAARVAALTEALQGVIAAHKAIHETTKKKATESLLDAPNALIAALAHEIWPHCEGDDCRDALQFVLQGVQAHVVEIEANYRADCLLPDGSLALAFAEYESEAMH